MKTFKDFISARKYSKPNEKFGKSIEKHVKR
jgi:hypothetical protein